MVNLSTWQDVMDLFYGIVKDTEASQTWFTTTQVEAWANQCLAEMAEHSHPVDKVISWAATPGTPTYEINAAGAGSLEVKLVEVDDEAIFPTTRARLWEMSRTWQQDTGKPRYYYTDGLADFDNTGLDIGFFPNPTTANTLRVTLSAVPDSVSNASMANPVMLPLWAVPGLLWGILSLAYKAETRLQNMNTAKFFSAMYEKVIERLRARSYCRVPQAVVYGSGNCSKSHRRDDWRALIPTSGVPYP